MYSQYVAIRIVFDKFYKRKKFSGLLQHLPKHIFFAEMFYYLMFAMKMKEVDFLQFNIL